MTFCRGEKAARQRDKERDDGAAGSSAEGSDRLGAGSGSCLATRNNQKKWECGASTKNLAVGTARAMEGRSGGVLLGAARSARRAAQTRAARSVACRDCGRKEGPKRRLMSLLVASCGL